MDWLWIIVVGILADVVITHLIAIWKRQSKWSYICGTCRSKGLRFEMTSNVLDVLNTLAQSHRERIHGEH